MTDEQQCTEKVFRDFHSHRCTRRAKRDGFCTQHHPDTVKARRDASSAKYEKERENSPTQQLRRERVTTAALREELEGVKRANDTLNKANKQLIAHAELMARELMLFKEACDNGKLDMQALTRLHDDWG